jgi:hypothetical protein
MAAQDHLASRHGAQHRHRVVPAQRHLR